MFVWFLVLGLFVVLFFVFFFVDFWWFFLIVCLFFDSGIWVVCCLNCVLVGFFLMDCLCGCVGGLVRLRLVLWWVGDGVMF